MRGGRETAKGGHERHRVSEAFSHGVTRIIIPLASLTVAVPVSFWPGIGLNGQAAVAIRRLANLAVNQVDLLSASASVMWPDGMADVQVSRTAIVKVNRRSICFVILPATGRANLRAALAAIVRAGKRTSRRVRRRVGVVC